MNETIWIAALLLGLAGGAHCAGMCGGISAVLSRSPAARDHALQYLMAYHGGRASSYALAGAIVGALGAAGLDVRGPAGAQQAALALASFGLVVTGVYLAGYAPLSVRLEAAGQVLWRRIEPWSRSLLPVTTPSRAFALGLAWGWLPCGLVYGALLLAFSSGDVVSAVSTMLAFAAGTLPSLIGLGMLARTARRRPVGVTTRRVAAGAILFAGLYGLVHASLHAPIVLEWCGIG